MIQINGTKIHSSSTKYGEDLSSPTHYTQHSIQLVLGATHPKRNLILDFLSSSNLFKAIDTLAKLFNNESIQFSYKRTLSI